MYIGIGNIFDHQLVHSYPVGYSASDGFWHLISTMQVYEAGSYKYLPDYLEAGYKDVVGFQPPLLFQLGAVFAHLTNIPVYDSLYLVVCFFLVLGVICIYLVIRDFNEKVAILAMPLTLFLFFSNFQIGILFGQVNFYLGSFFLCAMALLLVKKNIKYSWLLLSIILAATAMAHTSEYIFGVGFVILYGTWLYVHKEREVARGLAQALGLSLVIASYYLIIFEGTFGRVTGSNYLQNLGKVFSTAGFKIAYFADFGFLAYVIVIGIVCWLFLKKKFHLSFLFAGYMLIVGFSNYVGLYTRSFQTRFFWPVYLSIFFGLAIYQLARFVVIKKIFYFLIGVAFITIFLYYFAQLGGAYGLMNEYHYDADTWIRDNTPKDAKVLFFYGDSFDQSGQLPLTHRQSYLVYINDYVASLKDGKLRRNYFIKHIFNVDLGLIYRKTWFTFASHQSEDNVTFEMQRDICQFDYLIFDKQSYYAPELVNANLAIVNYMLRNRTAVVAHDNPLTVILHRTSKDCFPWEGLK